MLIYSGTPMVFLILQNPDIPTQNCVAYPTKVSADPTFFCPLTFMMLAMDGAF